MAEGLFRENPPSRHINTFLRRNMGKYMSETNNPTQLRDISRFYAEVEAAVATIDDKYTTIRSREVQQLLKS